MIHTKLCIIRCNKFFLSFLYNCAAIFPLSPCLKGQLRFYFEAYSKLPGFITVLNPFMHILQEYNQRVRDLKWGKGGSDKQC